MKRTITAQELVEKSRRENFPIVLDVRRAEDLAADPRQIPGAEWRDPSQVAQWAETLPAHAEVVVYCVRGRNVSNSVIDALHERGINACYVEGGIEAWKEATGTPKEK